MKMMAKHNVARTLLGRENFLSQNDSSPTPNFNKLITF
jgi:hypothetical protein